MGGLARKASRVKRRNASMPNSAAQARDATTRGKLGSIARKVESSFTTTTAPRADESLTTCLSVLDPVNANYNPPGGGLWTKPRFTQLCVCEGVRQSSLWNAWNLYRAHCSLVYGTNGQVSGSAPHPIRYKKKTVTVGNNHVLKVPDSTRKKQRGLQRPCHQPSAETHDLCALSRVDH